MSVLRQRADILRQIREFFSVRHVLEVETPALSHAASSEVHLQSMQVSANDTPSLYLHTSPELAMKRLLAAGSGDIYQLCKVFRAGEQGGRHNPEFTLLEWYRVGFDMAALMQEVEKLLTNILSSKLKAAPLTLSYRQAFLEYAQVDPFNATTQQLEKAFAHFTEQLTQQVSAEDWLDLILSFVVQPQLPHDRLVFMTGFPAAQASLAKLDDRNPNEACRFEVFVNGLELANGFEELIDDTEQRQRIKAEQKRRQAMELPQLPIDEHFLAALASGLPVCSGVALGVDRLVMLATGQARIADVISFDFDRA